MFFLIKKLLLMIEHYNLFTIQSFDSSDGPLPHHTPQLPTGHSNGLRKDNVSFEETFVSTSCHTHFLPTVTSTVAKPPFTRPKTGTEINSMGMSLEDKIIKLLNSSSEVSSNNNNSQHLLIEFIIIFAHTCT